MSKKIGVARFLSIIEQKPRNFYIRSKCIDLAQDCVFRALKLYVDFVL